MIIIPAGVLLWAIVVIAGGPSQFVQVLNGELRSVSAVISGWVGAWF